MINTARIFWVNVDGTCGFTGDENPLNQESFKHFNAKYSAGI